MNTKTQKKNIPGYGSEYEYLVPAYFALKLNNDKTVENFSIRSNAKDFGNFDDVIINVKRKNNELNYAIQLKHKDTNKKILPTNFEAKGDFNLKKYCDAHKLLKPEYKTQSFILYTNGVFEDSKMDQVSGFKMRKCHKDEDTFFDTSDCGSVYKFEVTDDTQSDYQNFFRNFTLYTDQRNYKEFKEKIRGVLKNEDVARTYEELFRNWHHESFSSKIIDRDTVNIHLVDAFLSGFLISNYHFFYDELKILRNVIRKFEVTIIKEEKSDFVKTLKLMDYTNYIDLGVLETYMEKYKMDLQKIQNCAQDAMNECILRLAKEYKFIDKKTNEISNEVKVKIILYFFEKIIFISFNEFSKNSVYRMLELYKAAKNNHINFVLLGKNFDNKLLSDENRVLENLEDIFQHDKLLYQEIVQKCKLIHGQRELIKCQDINSLVEIKNLFNMFQNQFVLEDIDEHLPTCYVKRDVLTWFLDTETLLELVHKNNYIFVINFSNYYNNIKRRIEDKKIIIADLKDRVEDDNRSVIYKTEDDYNVKLIEELASQNLNSNIYFLKMVAEDKLIPVMASGNIHKLKLKSLCEPIEEQDIHKIFTTPVNILTGEPGMGKSTMMTYLRNNCPLDMWAIVVDLKEHNSYFMEQKSAEEVVKHFLKLDNIKNEFASKLKYVFLKKRKVAMFLDGLDELEKVCIDNVLKVIEELGSLGFYTWVSFRHNLQEKVEEKLGKFSLDIIALDDAKQRSYIKERLQEKYKEDETEEITEKIFNANKIIDNGQILGVPLQLYIITEIFLNDGRSSIGDKIFVLTKLYKTFFSGRYKQSLLLKYKSQYNYALVEDEEDYLEKYEIAALHTLFDDEILNQLQLNLRRNQRFLTQIEEVKDILGIITKVDSEKRAIFEHKTFAEYFACVFLCKNFEKARILEKHLFSNRYRDLLLIFNIMLCEDHPIHLAVIYKNIELGDHSMDRKDIYDKGGRNPLHVYMICNTESKFLPSGDGDVEPKSVAYTIASEKSSRQSRKFINTLVRKFSCYEKDNIFEKDVAYYAVSKQDLFVIEAILEHHGLTYEAYDNLKKNNIVGNPYVVVVATLFGDVNLLSLALDKKNSLIRKYLDNDRFSIWDILITLSCEPSLKKCEMAEILTYFGIHTKSRILRSIFLTNDITLINFFSEKIFHPNSDPFEEHHSEELEDTAIIKNILNSENDDLSLHVAVKNKNLRKVEYLLDTIGIHPEAKDQDGYTALQLAAMYGHEDIFEFLLKKGGNPFIIHVRGRSILHFIAESGNIDLLHLFLTEASQNEDIFNIDIKDLYSKTPLMLAARKGHYEMCYFLLINWADSKICDIFQRTLLHYAAQGGNTKLITSLLSNEWNIYTIDVDKIPVLQNFDLNSKDNTNYSALVYAAEYRHEDAFTLLLSKGADIKHMFEYIEYVARLSNWKCVINQMIETGFELNTKYQGKTTLAKAIAEDNIEVAQFLLENGAKVQDLDSFKEAIKMPHFLELLFSKGFSTNFGEESDRNRFYDILKHERLEKIKFLLKKHAQIDLVSIFFGAVVFEDYEKMKFCLDNGVDINTKNDNGETALYEAAKRKIYGVIKFLVLNGADVNLTKSYHFLIWEVAIKHSETNFIASLLGINANLNVENDYEETPLSLALRKGNQEIVDLLMRGDARIDNFKVLLEAIERDNVFIIQKFLKLICIKFDNNQHSALFFAASLKGNINIIDYVLGQGFNIDAGNVKKETALLITISNKKFDAAKYLIIKGADVNCISCYYKTDILRSPLYRETIWKHLQHFDQDLKKIILSKPINLELVDAPYGKRPLCYAIQNEDLYVVEQLLNNQDHIKLDDKTLLEAVMTRNKLLLKILQEKTDFDERKDSVTLDLLRNRRFDIVSNFKFERNQRALLTPWHEQEVNNYQMLHFAIYAGDVSYVEELVENYIDLENVDKYNKFYPLHFATRNKILCKDLLIAMTRTMYKLYDSGVAWKLKDMRHHILELCPLDPQVCSKTKCVYLTKEFDLV